MSAHDRARAPALSAALLLAAGLALALGWSRLGGTLAEILLAAVVGGALVVLYRLRRYARDRLLYSATPGRAPGSGADARSGRTGV